jgi:hypothetical protein
MRLIEAAEILERHNNWRRGDDSPQGNPTEIGLAIDIVLKAAARYEEVRKWNPRCFKEAYLVNLRMGKFFDDIVDERIKARAEA